VRRGEAPKVLPEQLYPRRLAVRALELVLGHLGMSEAALKFNADDAEQAFPGPYPGEVRIYEAGWDRGQKPLAHVFLEEAAGRARVVIPAAHLIVRPNHRKTFRAEDVGIQRHAGEPDVDMEADLSPVLDQFGVVLRTVPQKTVVRRRRTLAAGGSYKGALGLGRGS
jgi:hypothetical protein